LSYPASPPASAEGEADGGQAETSIQYHMLNNRNHLVFRKLDTNVKILAYIVLDRKPRKKDFQFYSGNFNKLILLDFFNPKSAIKNLKSCLNGLFVQALYRHLDTDGTRS